jgi:hypothetical protein
MIVALVAACAGNSAPVGFLVSPRQEQTDAYGGWIELTLNRDSAGKPQRVHGELIAVTADSVWVLMQTAGLVVPTAAVTRGKLTAYQEPSGTATGWTALGVLSTASNGLLLILTAPLWIITGTASASSASHEPERFAPPFAWADLATFARFPQGMPAGSALGSLQPRIKPKSKSKK